MFGLIFVALIVVPAVELYVLFQIADSIGWLLSLASMLVISLIGAALVRWQTNGAWNRVVTKLQAGKMPSNELVDGALMLFGGALLLTPGFFTDAFGLAMFIPPLRALTRRLVIARLGSRVTTFATVGGVPFGGDFGTTRPGRRGPFIDVDQVRVERIPDSPTELPPSEIHD